MPNLFLGDAAELLEDLSYDLVVTSPPYDNLRTYGNHDDWDFEKFKKVASPLSRNLKEGGVIVWNVADATIKGSETGSSYRQALHFLDECGLRLHDTMIWEKNTSAFPASPKGNRYTQIFEFCFVFSKGKPKTANLLADKPNRFAGTPAIRGKNVVRQKTGELVEQPNKGKLVREFGVRNNIWRVPNNGSWGQQDRTLAKKHPATMPLDLAKGHVLTWSNEGDVVCDPFLGSGTTGLACKETNREFVGVEVNPDYFALAGERLA